MKAILEWALPKIDYVWIVSQKTIDSPYQIAPLIELWVRQL
jgi:hypothetical protein